MSKQKINGIIFEFIKDIKSDTRVEGCHVKIDGKHYVVLNAGGSLPFGGLSAYTATRTGKIENLSAPLFKVNGNNLQDGIDKLIVLKAKEAGHIEE